MTGRLTSVGDWTALPSGESRRYGPDRVAYVATGAGFPAWWWIVIGGRTEAQGPAATVDVAKRVAHIVMLEVANAPAQV